MNDNTEETLIAAGISLLAEAAAIVLFVSMIAVWIAIYGTM